MVPPLGLALRFTVTGASPALGLAAALTVGSECTVTSTFAVALTPLASVRVRTAVNWEADV